MTWKLSTHAYVSLPGLETIYGAYVIETTTGDITTRWGIGTSHYPAGSQGNSMDLSGKENNTGMNEETGLIHATTNI